MGLREGVTLDELAPLVREVIGRGERVRLRVFGASMLPFIRSGEMVELAAVPSTGCARGTVVLVETGEGGHVLHRVTRLVAGGVLTRGDANLAGEGPFPPERVIARATGLVRGCLVLPLDAGVRGFLGRLWHTSPAGPWLLRFRGRARRAGGRVLRRAGLLPRSSRMAG